jgi:protein-S-isoprenylcysteine O-methyltransferase Ste14
MPLVTYVISTLLLSVAAFAVFRIVVRRDYRREGRLKPVAAMLELLICILYFAFPYLYNPSGWAAFWSAEMHVGDTMRIIGSMSVVVGALVAFPTMASLGLPQSFGQRPQSLKQNGLYQVTRNPQVVGGALMPLGIVMLFPSWYAVGWLALYAAIFHLMVITEEEHLLNLSGDEYRLYCGRVPRYLGFWRARTRPTNNG